MGPLHLCQHNLPKSGLSLKFFFTSEIRRPICFIRYIFITKFLLYMLGHLLGFMRTDTFVLVQGVEYQKLKVPHQMAPYLRSSVQPF